MSIIFQEEYMYFSFFLNFLEHSRKMKKIQKGILEKPQKV